MKIYIWPLQICLIFFLLLHSSHSFPISDGLNDVGVVGAYLPGYVTVFISLAALLLLVYFIFGCVCCPNKSIKALSYQNGFPVSRLNENSLQFDNPSEFAIFPPNAAVINLQPVSSFSPFDDKVTFEPLPDILPRNLTSGPSAACSSKPAHFTALLRNKVSLHDWFDDPNSNFPREQLQYFQELGNGWFGRVIEGEAMHINNYEEKTPVIVKILREEASPSEHLFFLHEIRPYRDLNHPNVMRLLGRCLESDPFLLILDHSMKDLKTYLIQQENRENLLNNGLLLKMANNVASGLRYLHDNEFCHMDLAAHNCFVTKDLNVKIGDYGIAFDHFKGDYYCLGDIALPIRWYSPETLVCSETTLETKEITKDVNVWAFGVILWEIFEFGKLPYEELTNEEVIQKVLVERSVQLPPPTLDFQSRNEICLVMKECWKPVHYRPSMEKIENFLVQLYNERHNLKTLEASFEQRWNALQSKYTEVNFSSNEPVPLKFENDFSEKCDTQNCSSDGELFSSLEISYDTIPSNNLNVYLSPSLRVLNGSIDGLTDNDPFVNSVSFGHEKYDADTLSNISDKDNMQSDDDLNHCQIEDTEVHKQISAAIKDLDLVLSNPGPHISRHFNSGTPYTLSMDSLNQKDDEAFLKEIDQVLSKHDRFSVESNVNNSNAKEIMKSQESFSCSSMSEYSHSGDLNERTSGSYKSFSKNTSYDSSHHSNVSKSADIPNVHSSIVVNNSKDNKQIEVFLPNIQTNIDHETINTEDRRLSNATECNQVTEVLDINQNKPEKVSVVPDIIVYESPTIINQSNDDSTECDLNNCEELVKSSPESKKSFRFVFKEESDSLLQEANSSDKSSGNSTKKLQDGLLEFSDNNAIQPLTSTPMKSSEYFSTNDEIHSLDFSTDSAFSNNSNQIINNNNFPELQKENIQLASTAEAFSVNKIEMNKETNSQVTNADFNIRNQSSWGRDSFNQESFATANLSFSTSKNIASESSVNTLPDSVKLSTEVSTESYYTPTVSNSDTNALFNFNVGDSNIHLQQLENEKFEDVDLNSNDVGDILVTEKFETGTKSENYCLETSQFSVDPIDQANAANDSQDNVFVIPNESELTHSLSNSPDFSKNTTHDTNSNSINEHFETISTDSPNNSSIAGILKDSPFMNESKNVTYLENLSLDKNENFIGESNENNYAKAQLSFIDDSSEEFDVSKSKLTKNTYDVSPDPFHCDENKIKFAGNLRPQKSNSFASEKLNGFFSDDFVQENARDVVMKENEHSLHLYGEVIMEDLVTGEQTISTQGYLSCDDYENSGDSDEILKINTETDEAIIVDSSEALIGFVPSRSIELLQEYEVIPTLNPSFRVDDEKESSDSMNLDTCDSTSSSPAAVKYSESPNPSPESNYSQQIYRNFCLQNEIIEEELTDEITSPSSLHSNVSISSNEIFMDEDRMSQSSGSCQQEEMYETSVLPTVDHMYMESDEGSKTDISNSPCSQQEDKDSMSNGDIGKNHLSRSQEDVMHSWQPSQSIKWLSDETLDVDRGSQRPIIIEGREILAGESFPKRGVSAEDITSALSELTVNNHRGGFSVNRLSVSQSPSPYSSVESSPCRDTVYTPDFESDSEESASVSSCSSTSGSFECIHNKFKDTVDISKVADESEASASSREQSPMKVFSKTWDCHATPTKGVLVTPEKKFNSMRKSVSFHEEDPQVVYEYPPASDSSEGGYDNEDAQAEFLWNIDYRQYADWDLQAGENEEIEEEIIEIEELDSEPYVRRPTYTGSSVGPLNRPMLYSLTSGFSDEDFDSLTESISQQLPCNAPSNSPEEGKRGSLSEHQIDELRNQLSCLAEEENRLKITESLLDSQKIDCSSNNPPPTEILPSSVQTSKNSVVDCIGNPVLVHDIIVDELVPDSQNCNGSVAVHKENPSALIDSFSNDIVEDIRDIEEIIIEELSEDVGDQNVDELFPNKILDDNISIESSNMQTKSNSSSMHVSTLEELQSVAKIFDVAPTIVEDNDKPCTSNPIMIDSPVHDCSNTLLTENDFKYVHENTSDDPSLKYLQMLHENNSTSEIVCVKTIKEFENCIHEETDGISLNIEGNFHPKNLLTNLNHDINDVNFIANDISFNHLENSDNSHFKSETLDEGKWDAGIIDDIPKPFRDAAQCLKSEAVHEIFNHVNNTEAAVYNSVDTSFQSEDLKLVNFLDTQNSERESETKKKSPSNLDFETPSDMKNDIGFSDTNESTTKTAASVSVKSFDNVDQKSELLSKSSETAESEKLFCAESVPLVSKDSCAQIILQSNEPILREMTKDHSAVSENGIKEEISCTSKENDQYDESLEAHTRNDSGIFASTVQNFKDLVDGKTLSQASNTEDDQCGSTFDSDKDIGVPQCDNLSNTMPSCTENDESESLMCSSGIVIKISKCDDCDDDLDTNFSEKGNVPVTLLSSNATVPEIVVTPASESDVEDELEEYLREQLALYHAPPEDNEDFSVTSHYTGHPFEDYFGDYHMPRDTGGYTEAFNFEFDHGDFFEDLNDYPSEISTEDISKSFSDSCVQRKRSSSLPSMLENGENLDSKDSSLTYSSSQDLTRL